LAVPGRMWGVLCPCVYDCCSVWWWCRFDCVCMFPGSRLCLVLNRVAIAGSCSCVGESFGRRGSWTLVAMSVCALRACAPHTVCGVCTALQSTALPYLQPPYSCATTLFVAMSFAAHPCCLVVCSVCGEAQASCAVCAAVLVWAQGVGGWQHVAEAVSGPLLWVWSAQGGPQHRASCNLVLFGDGSCVT
jgi:hypothetical protein